MKKIILFIAAYILCLDPVFSQEIEWQNTIGGSETEWFTSFQQTADGGYILGGMSSSNISGDKTENNMDTVPPYSYDYWIVKTDALGNIQWQNTIGGGSTDHLNSIKQTSDGGYILGGSSGSNISGDKTEICYGGWDYWVVKTDSAGNIQWQNTIGGDRGDYLQSIQQIIDGGYILGGWSGSGISGDKTENNWDTTLVTADYWIVKINVSGNIQWQKTIGGDDFDDLRSLQQTDDKGFILGGTSVSNISGDKTENCIGYEDYWIVKTDSIGNIEWQNNIGGDYGDHLSSVQKNADGGYILGGFSISGISGDKTDSCGGSFDYWMVITDSIGNIQWQRTIGGNADDRLYSIQQTADSGYILGGWSLSGISGDKTESCIGGYDYWIIKTDLSGNIQWQNTIGGKDHEELFSLQQTDDGGFILGGWSGSDISGDKTENCNGGYDYWIVKITDKYNSITGKLFIDANSNAMQDTGEPAINNKMVTETNTGRFAFSQSTGVYYLNVLDSGNFSVSPSLINYYNPVPATRSIYFSGINQTDSLNDFAFQPTGVFNDICITISPMGNFRAGFDASYMINYENVGTTTLNATVIFFPDNEVTFVSANPIATSVTTDSVVWNVGTLTPFQTGSILVTVHVNAGTPIGTLINSNVRIEPVAGDNYPGCNYAYWEVYTTGAIDPNAIIVDRDTVLTTELPSPPFLNYIIYFQNTGNDTAFNVKVLNPMDTFKLDIHSFEFVAASHPVNIEYKIWERNLYFTFDNILLPDSNINEPASHGFIRYKIKPLSTLVVGDSIKNNAAIYFDFNQPVLTDTAVTEIVLPTGAEELDVQSLKFKVFPNPVRNELEIRNPQQGDKTKYEITISDITGRLNLRVQEAKLPAKLDVSKFAAGIYFLVINDGNTFFRTKVVKQ